MKKRSTTGCLTCRRRRKKCDEQKPVCKGCERNFLPCEWPQCPGIRRRRRRREAPQGPLLLEETETSEPEDEFCRKEKGKETKFHIIQCTDIRSNNHPDKNVHWQFENYSKAENSVLTKYDEQKCRFVEASADEGLAFTMGDDFSKYQEAGLGESDGIPESLDPLHDISIDFLNSVYVDRTIDMHLNRSTVPLVQVPTDALIIHPEVHSAQNFGYDEKHTFFEDLLRRYRRRDEVTDADLDSINLQEFLFYCCAKGFIPKLDTQYTHPSLTTDATFVPQASKNALIKNVFICCGATYLAWCDLERYQQLSDELYINCKAQILDYIEQAENYADDDWLFAALQLLCIRDKNSFTGTVDNSIWHLSKAFFIIRERYYDATSTDLFDDPLLDLLLRESIVLQPQERMFIESFIYQYSISILFARDISCLPNPCAVFRALSLVLKCPVYNLEGHDQWMNNPLLGPSLDTFEILAKLSYIARIQMPLEPKWHKKVLQLRNMCIYYTQPSPAQKIDDLQWFNYRVTSMVGLLVTKTCDLFASKILNYTTFDVTSPKVQMQTKEIINLFKKVPADHQIWGILSWTIVITGAFTRDPKDQLYIIERVQHIAERAHSYCGIKMSSFLHDIWNTADGLKFLFDRNKLAQVDL
ncbi:LANO_0C00540g1_1 [Lachancea nothofagi CBS 11611]|uniref:LANO_0C00540g1_1 n=1 Tax=Lachancea nothofagi CBS 11611 TaxID=1266666 RepID=A0A1G4J3V0_9SACH|nr:LANO_0C00540g1_1 [Lachancea nothofagi CBS 11611]